MKKLIKVIGVHLQRGTYLYKKINSSRSFASTIICEIIA